MSVTKVVLFDVIQHVSKQQMLTITLIIVVWDKFVEGFLWVRVHKNNCPINHIFSLFCDVSTRWCHCICWYYFKHKGKKIRHLFFPLHSLRQDHKINPRRWWNNSIVHHFDIFPHLPCMIDYHPHVLALAEHHNNIRVHNKIIISLILYQTTSYNRCVFYAISMFNITPEASSSLTFSPTFSALGITGVCGGVSLSLFFFHFSITRFLLLGKLQVSVFLSL